MDTDEDDALAQIDAEAMVSLAELAAALILRLYLTSGMTPEKALAMHVANVQEWLGKGLRALGELD